MNREPRLVAGSLAAVLCQLDHAEPVIAAATPGGLAVGRDLAAITGWPVAFAPALPLLPPWPSDLAYGAVAFDGSVVVDEFLVEALELASADVRAAVARRVAELAGADRRPLAGHPRRPVVLVDDNLAPALVLEAALAGLRNAGAGDLVVALDGERVRSKLHRLAGHADAVYHAVSTP